MLPNNNNPLWNCYSIYEKLLNPYTQTVGSEYLIPILKKQFQYSKNSKQSLSLAIIRIPEAPGITANPALNPKTPTLLNKIITKIRNDLRPPDMMFYDGRKEITFILPHTNKKNSQKLLNRIVKDLQQIYIGDIPLLIDGGYAEFPADSVNFIKLQECAARALNIALQSKENRIIGYFTERRSSVRIPLKIEVRYTAPETGKRIACSRNLSEGGIMISGMPDLVQKGTIKLSFNLPNVMGSKIEVAAKTVWNKIHAKTGKIDIGLCFVYSDNTEEQPSGLLPSFRTAQKAIREFILNTPPPIVPL